ALDALREVVLGFRVVDEPRPAPGAEAAAVGVHQPCEAELRIPAGTRRELARERRQAGRERGERRGGDRTGQTDAQTLPPGMSQLRAPQATPPTPDGDRCAKRAQSTASQRRRLTGAAARAPRRRRRS